MGDQLRVIDVDTHLTEPADLWTSRAPAGWEERVPRVVDVDGSAQWFIGDIPLGRAGSHTVVHRDGGKSRGMEFFGWKPDDIHVASYDMDARVEMMDTLGIWAQILYPNIAGFGTQRFAEIADIELRRLCVTLYNDAMAEIQERSDGRLFPMALIPWWEVDGAVAEVVRAKELGLRGIVTCSDPQNVGLPDLGERLWDPLWEVCADQDMPVNFHIGASATAMSWYGTSPWPSQSDDRKLAIGSAMMYLSNARVLANLIFSGVLERFADLRVVSVESGIGWIPFVLDSLDYQLHETAPDVIEQLSMTPTEYFRRQVYGCFWFEKTPASVIEQVGADNVLFETDFPHPTCLYPDVATRIDAGLADVSADVKRKVLQDNAAALYRIPLPA